MIPLFLISFNIFIFTAFNKLSILITLLITFHNMNFSGNGTAHFVKHKQWKGINRKQSTRWQHLSQLKASAFFTLQNFFSCYETQQLILGTGTAIWWVTEPHCLNTKIYLLRGIWWSKF